MTKCYRFLLAACFASLLPISAFSEAPVVDDSENFAMIDEQQAAIAQSADNAYERDEEPAFAHDSAPREYGNDKSNTALLDKIQGLQQELQELRGQLEVQTHDLKLLQQQQLTFYKDLDARLHNSAPAATAQNQPEQELSIGANEPIVDAKTLPKAAPQSSSVAPPVSAVVGPNHANPAEEQISYLAAYDKIKNKQFDEALIAMQTFVVQYPQGGYTANAEYWLGELYMVKKSYPEAINHFEVVLRQFPSSSKASASMLKIGYALAASGKRKEAIARLQQVMKTYPDTNTARLASAKLESLTT